jgi:hemoglobin-like flavoprotein
VRRSTRLFEANLAAKLFDGTNMAEQRRKFTVIAVVRVLDQPELLVGEVADSGRRHVNYGVQDAITRRRRCVDVGARTRPWGAIHSGTRAAWREAYDLLAAVMRRSAGRPNVK